MPVKVVKRGEKFRVVEASTGRIAKRGGTAIDGGGHSSRSSASSQARAVNRDK